MRKCACRVLAVIMLLSVLLCGCGQSRKERQEIEQKLSGTWELIKEPGKLYPEYGIHFSTNGTVFAKVSDYSVYGTYEVKEDCISITYSGRMQTGVGLKYTYENGVLRLWDGRYEMEKTNKNLFE